MKRIAYLGPEGTVSDESARHFFQGEAHQFIPYRLISDVYGAAVSGEAAVSVIPIENTIDGSVKDHVDLLVHGSPLPIQAEWVYPSVQNLIGYRRGAGEAGTSDEPKASPYAGIRKIISIEVAIAQCRTFLKNNLPGVEFEFVNSTAEGVKRVMEAKDEGLAAIGTKLAAEMYGLDLLAENITDHQNNYTRFILVGMNPPELRPTETYKTTILVTLPEDYPGALHQVLSAFAWRRVNLSKIESRPTKLKLGSYYFYIDIEGSMNSVLLPAAIAEIEALGCQVRVLGSYPTYLYEQAHLEV
ncbi:prephenate dehydratase [Paenibacillus sp. J31TS4]|uniref:prephenate dehydratase n=1 Tax=Paenibacillus sp. J31TS4 TaxID=2807195 RepID=UPI001B2CD0C7|nr:prephenate dehydratase [Paenibacillus sp. J31TS4]GIP39215.1 prephenate dehydratase [Paenibacillus sp. J31TS4]